MNLDFEMQPLCETTESGKQHTALAMVPLNTAVTLLLVGSQVYGNSTALNCSHFPHAYFRTFVDGGYALFTRQC